jgi:uncharacterized protein (DUF1330 family)
VSLNINVTVYAIAQLRLTDRAVYDRYQARFMEIFRRHPGTLPAADESPEVIEGKWDREKLVLMSFPDEAAFRGRAQSPEYQEISKDRLAGADTLALLVQGLQ